jgi:excisionase family DNA binding protein
MNKRPLDLGTTKQALANLDRIARENPHLIDPTRATWTEEDIAEMIVDKAKTTYTVEEAADVLNCHPQTIRRSIRNGGLKAAKVGRGLTISRLDLEAYYRAKGGGQLFADDTTSEAE